MKAWPDYQVPVEILRIAFTPLAADSLHPNDALRQKQLQFVLLQRPNIVDEWRAFLETSLKKWHHKNKFLTVEAIGELGQMSVYFERCVDAYHLLDVAWAMTADVALDQ